MKLFQKRANVVERKKCYACKSFSTETWVWIPVFSPTICDSWISCLVFFWAKRENHSCPDSSNMTITAYIYIYFINLNVPELVLSESQGLFHIIPLTQWANYYLILWMGICPAVNIAINPVEEEELKDRASNLQTFLSIVPHFVYI